VYEGSAGRAGAKEATKANRDLQDKL